jgi:chromosome segregation ATPase
MHGLSWSIPTVSGRPVEGEDRHLGSRRSDAADAMLKSQIHRTIGLKRVLEEKQKVIRELHSEAELRRKKLEEVVADRESWEARYQEVAAEAELRKAKLEALDRTLTQAREEWARERQELRGELRALQSEHEAILKSPIHYFRKGWQQRTNKRRDESG